MKSPIEEAIGHELERETRAGVPHFKHGQHAARLVESDDVAELSFVDVMGHAWLVVCARTTEGAWDPVLAIKGGAGGTLGARSMGPLTEKMLEALEAAE